MVLSFPSRLGTSNPKLGTCISPPFARAVLTFSLLNLDFHGRCVSLHLSCCFSQRSQTLCVCISLSLPLASTDRPVVDAQTSAASGQRQGRPLQPARVQIRTVLHVYNFQLHSFPWAVHGCASSNYYMCLQLSIVFCCVVLTYIDASGPTQGVSPGFSFYLVSIANASSGAGRLMSGILTDHFGALTFSFLP